MRAVLIGLALLLVAAPVAAQRDTTPPPAPGPLTVETAALQPTGVLFTVTWEAVLDPPANVPVPVYRWTAGFSDGSEPVQGGGGHRSQAAHAVPRKRGDVRVRLCRRGGRGRQCWHPSDVRNPRHTGEAVSADDHARDRLSGADDEGGRDTVARLGVDPVVLASG